MDEARLARNAYMREWNRKNRDAINERRRLKTARRPGRIRPYLPASATLEERFWAKVDKGEGCWLWRGVTNRPKIQVANGRPHQLAARLVWEWTYGPPGNFEVCHHCDEPRCVRPDHLFLGTHADNMADAKRKGRLRAVGNKSRAKLSPSDVLEIRRLYEEGHGTSEIARRFGVVRGTIGFILNGTTWSEVA